MSKHILQTRGHVFEWDDDTIDYSRRRSLLNLYTGIGNMHSWTTYIGEDPEKVWNTHVRELQDKVIDWLLELDDSANTNLDGS